MNESFETTLSGLLSKQALPLLLIFLCFMTFASRSEDFVSLQYFAVGGHLPSSKNMHVNMFEQFVIPHGSSIKSI